MSQEKPIHIIGAGISGLSMAFYLTRAGYKVTVFEKEDRVGGLLGTKSTAFGLVEQAANAFLANKELEDVSKIIGVKLLNKKEVAKNRFIYRNGKPRRWPLSFLGSLRIFVFFIGFKFFKKYKKHETLEEWGKRSMGHEATEYLLTPAMQGIFAERPDSLSAKLILQTLFLKRSPRGQLKGSVSAEKGMGQWVDKMRDYLLSKGCQFQLQNEWGERELKVPHVLAMDFEAAKEFLKNHSPQLATHFDKTESTALTSVTLHFESEHDNCQGFGCLFPEKEDFHSLGVLFNHHAFENRAEGGVLSETWIFNDRKKMVSTMDEAQLMQNILTDRLKLRGREEKPMRQFVHQWPKRIPLYNVELEKALENDLSGEKNLFLFGNYLGNLGLSKILVAAKELSQKVEQEAQWEK